MSEPLELGDVPGRLSTGSGPGETGVPLSATGVDVRRGGVQVLTGVDVAAEPGRPLALTGPSGSGKSTLLAVLGALLVPDAGQVVLGDTVIRSGDPSIRRRIGVVLQGYGLVGLLTAQENVEVDLRAAGVPGREAVPRAFQALERVGLGGREGHLVEDLSGGQQQRVALARTLAPRPAVVLADEPTAELDHDTRDEVLELLLDYAWGGRVLVIATHDSDVAGRCDEQLHLIDGKVAPAG